MVSFVQPYTKEDLERGEQIVQRLHGLKGYDAWAEHIAKVIAAERAKNEQMREALTQARTWFLLPENVDLNGSDRVYRIVDAALGTKYPSHYDVPLTGHCGSR